jgi:hypothetical protein
MVIGTFFTLFVVPSIYMLLGRNYRKRGADEGEDPAPEIERNLQPELV